MTDLRILGDNFTNVTGIKAKDSQNNEYTYINLTQSDEGKVVSNGALVAQTSDTVTTNDTYDTTLINSLTVNVSGGGGTDTFAAVQMKTIENYSSEVMTTISWYAFYGCTSLKTVSIPNLTKLEANLFNKCSNLEKVYFPKVTNANFAKTFQYCTKLKNIALPLVNSVMGSAFLEYCSSLEAVDLGNVQTIQQYGFQHDVALEIIVLRMDNAITALNNINALDDTPFASGGTGGTLYVPASLISSYQSATNWSTILGYTNNQIKSIESTHTDPTAPIDLTLYYADGTLIPTT